MATLRKNATTASSVVVASTTQSPGTSLTAVSAVQNSPPKVSKDIIALLVVIGILAVAVLIGFGIYFRTRKYSSLGVRSPSGRLVSLGLSTAVGASNASTGVAAGGTKATKLAASSDGHDTRVHGRSPELGHELEIRQSPQMPPQYQVDLSREASTGKEAGPSYILVGHPYQTVTQERTSKASTLDMRMRPAALVLPVSSFASGSGPPSSSRPTPLTVASPVVVQGSPSSFAHVKTDSPGRSKAQVSRRGKRVAPPPVSMLKSLVPPIAKKRFSKSFLTFDDDDSLCSNLHSPAALSPATNQKLEQNAGRQVVNSTPKLMTAVAPYKPVLQDELPLGVGDVVRVLREYDDGWCIVEQTEVTNVLTGVVPKICLREQT